MIKLSKCSFCKGELEKDRVNHMLDIDDLILIIKNVPANVCNQCGEYYLGHYIALKVEEIVDELRDSGAEVIIVNFEDKAA